MFIFLSVLMYTLPKKIIISKIPSKWNLNVPVNSKPVSSLNASYSICSFSFVPKNLFKTYNNKQVDAKKECQYKCIHFKTTFLCKHKNTS